MTQKLTKLIGEIGFTSNAVSPIKSKIGIRSQASKKAWRTRKRMKAARAAANKEITITANVINNLTPISRRKEITSSAAAVDGKVEEAA